MNEDEVSAGLAPTSNHRYAERVGAQLLVAGQVPLNSAGQPTSIDPAKQATACLENLLTLLGVHGFEAGDIRRLVVYVVGEHQNDRQTLTSPDQVLGPTRRQSSEPGAYRSRKSGS